MTHALKTWPPYFDSVVQGKKAYELRKNDRPFTVGDMVLLQEYTLEKGYTGNEAAFEITSILKDMPEMGLKKGYVILGIKPKENEHQHVS